MKLHTKKWLNHNEWIIEQFQEKYLKKNYRNTFIHASIVESVLANECRIDNFCSANKCLLYSKDITTTEFSTFNTIRRERNKIAHKIFKNGGLSQKDIDKVLRKLMATILAAYKTSDFLNKNLFKKYKIKRVVSVLWSKQSTNTNKAKPETNK